MIRDLGFLKRLISGARATGLNGVMVALPCYTKVKTQMKLHPRLLCENTSALGETLATDKISHHTYKSLVQPAMERTLSVAGVTILLCLRARLFAGPFPVGMKGMVHSERLPVPRYLC